MCFSMILHCISQEASIYAKRIKFVFKRQQKNLGRRFGASKMHLCPRPPPMAVATDCSKAVIVIISFFEPRHVISNIRAF